MKKWEKFWAEEPTKFGERDFLRQVGHTIKGQPYPEADFEAMILSITRSLALTSEDVLLDLCCGNGLITARLSDRCAFIDAVDFSAPLIEMARKSHSRNNIAYHQIDALEIKGYNKFHARFDKILMSGGLQYFQHNEFERLICGLLEVADGRRLIVLGGVPDLEKRHVFYGSLKNKIKGYYYRASGRDRIGTWWTKRYIADVCARLNLRCAFDDASEGRPGGHYRFDVTIC